MTKLTYNILRNGVVVKNVVSYTKAMEEVEALGNGYTIKAVYTPFNPENTPKIQEARATRAKKVTAKRALS